MTPSELQQFNAVVTDQFGIPLAPQPGFHWSLSGPGTLVPSGLYLAPAAAGRASVTAAAGPLTGTAVVSTGAAGPVNAPVAAQATVSTNVAGNNPALPAVAMASTGNYVIVWSNAANGGEFDGALYNVSGNPIGSQFKINTSAKGGPKAPAVAMNA